MSTFDLRALAAAVNAVPHGMLPAVDLGSSQQAFEAVAELPGAEVSATSNNERDRWRVATVKIDGVLVRASGLVRAEGTKRSTERAARQPTLELPLACSLGPGEPVLLGDIEPIAALARTARKGEAAE